MKSCLEWWPVTLEFLETLEKSNYFGDPWSTSAIYALETLEISNFQANFSHFNFQKYKFFPTRGIKTSANQMRKYIFETSEILGVIPRSFKCHWNHMRSAGLGSRMGGILSSGAFSAYLKHWKSKIFSVGPNFLPQLYRKYLLKNIFEILLK